MSESFPTAFGRYQLIERLAVGGMAELFLANVSGAHGFERTIVIKRLLPHMLKDAQFTTMFIDEAKLTAQLMHPKIAQTYELGKHEDRLFIAMEFVDGIDVLSMLRECAYRRIRIPPEVAVYIAHEILDALDFAHNQVDADGKPMGIVHRDISPSNVILSRRGGVKVIDFGIARATEQHHQTKAGTLKGKYGYMSPEQVVGATFDGRSDLFSVAIVLAEMLTGRRLFAAQNELDVLLMVRDAKLDRFRRFGEHIDESLKEIIYKSLRKDISARYASAADFRDVLDEWMFANRHRVTPSTVAQIVDSLYEDAWNRKRKSMKESDGGGESPAEIPAAASMNGEISSITAPATPSYQDEIAGIPSGSLQSLDSMPILSIETEPELEIAVGSQDSGIHREPRSSLPRDRAPSPAIAATSPMGLDAIPAPIVQDLTDKTLSPDSTNRMIVTMQPSDPSASDFDDRMVSGPGASSRLPENVPIEIDFSEPSVAIPPRLNTIIDEPDDNGSLDKTAAIAVLYRLFSDKKSGLLVVNCGAIRKEIYIESGNPVYISSNVASELFGEYLVKKGAISSGELAMALAMMPHYGGKLGDTMVGLGLMKPLEVFRMLTNQVSDKLIDVCTWGRGTYAWHDGRENPREAFPLDLDAFKLLGAGAMALPSEGLHGWVQHRGHEKPRSVGSPAVRPEHFQIGAMVRDVYNSLTGRSSVSELADRYTDIDDRLQFLRVLFMLIHTDLATF